MITEIDLTKELKSYLTFILHEEVFALEIEKVVEIIEVPHITHIPKAPKHMKGVINLRGQVIPLIDTCVKFGLPPVQVGVNTCIIIIDLQLEDKRVRFGALVDQVQEVLEQEEGSLAPSPNIEANYNLNFIKGILKEKDNFVIVLDIDQTFSVEEAELLRANNLESVKDLSE